MSSRAGLTLMEVLVALSLLGLAVATLLALQAAALRAHRTAQVVRALAAVADSELAARLALPTLGPAPCSQLVLPANVLSCSSELLPCDWSREGWNCRDPEHVRAVLARVRVEGRDGRLLELESHALDGNRR